jgi:hypothetical protein
MAKAGPRYPRALISTAPTEGRFRWARRGKAWRAKSVGSYSSDASRSASGLVRDPVARR